MHKISKVENCPFCGKESYYHQIKRIMLRYKSHSIHVNQPGYWCDQCGEGVIGGDDRKATQKELQTLRAKIDGLVVPDEIKRIREKLNLTQQVASDIFGGGVNAFSRYERGETPIPRPLSQLLHLLDINPRLLMTIHNRPAESTLKRIKQSSALKQPLKALDCFVAWFLAKTALLGFAKSTLNPTYIRLT